MKIENNFGKIVNGFGDISLVCVGYFLIYFVDHSIVWLLSFFGQLKW